jgi:hypothetical protein
VTSGADCTRLTLIMGEGSDHDPSETSEAHNGRRIPWVTDTCHHPGTWCPRTAWSERNKVTRTQEEVTTPTTHARPCFVCSIPSVVFDTNGPGCPLRAALEALLGQDRYHILHQYRVLYAVSHQSRAFVCSIPSVPCFCMQYCISTWMPLARCPRGTPGAGPP